LKLAIEIHLRRYSELKVENTVDFSLLLVVTSSIDYPSQAIS